jgi:5-methylcytosine-specific restriction endonuclease McrA
LQEAISAYARGDVVYGIGDTLPPVFGGIQRCRACARASTCNRSSPSTGRIMQGFTPPLCNRTLFRRDDHRCLYCGTSTPARS